MPIDKDAANVFFQLIAKRYEKKYYNCDNKYAVFQMG